MVNNSLPKKTQEDSKKKNLPVEEVEVLDVEVIGKGYDTPLEQELAERKVREGLLYDRLSDKKINNEKMTMAENRALFNLTKIDFTDPADRDEITAPDSNKS